MASSRTTNSSPEDAFTKTITTSELFATSIPPSISSVAVTLTFSLSPIPFV